MKLVYTYALGAYAERRGGSSPLCGTFLLHLSMWLLLFLCLVKPVFAQDSTDLYTKYRTDYLYQRDIYQKDYLDYLNKKDAYAQFGTVTAEKDKIISTKNTFLSQNSMLRAYLMALRVTLNDSPTNQFEIDKLESWLEAQNLLIADLNTSQELQSWSETFKSRYVIIQQQLFSGLIQTRINLRLKTIADIKKLAESANVEWSLNYTDKEAKVYESFQEALKSTQKNQRENYFYNFYPDALDELNHADVYLKSIISDLKSTIIKNNQ